MFYSQFPMQYHLVQTVENQGKFGSDYYTMKEKESNTIEKRISCSTSKASSQYLMNMY